MLETGNYYLPDALAITSLYRYVTSIISEVWFQSFLSVFHGYATTGLSVIQMQVMGAQMDAELYVNMVKFNVNFK